MHSMVPTAEQNFDWRHFAATASCTTLLGQPKMAGSDEKGKRPFRASEKPLPATGILRWEGGGLCTLLPTTANCATQGSLAPSEGEVYLYLRVDFNRLSV